MEITHRIEDTLCIVSIRGNLTLNEADKAKRYVIPLLEDSEMQSFILNLEEMALIDSLGVGCISAVFKMLQDRSKTLALCHLAPKNARILQMIGLDRIIRIYETEAEAVSASLSGKV